MSYRPTPQPAVERNSAVKLVLQGRDRAIGKFHVKRLLPASRQRLVGPFVYVDHMGPHQIVDPASGDMPQHPHINLATVTYLFEGAITHRDSTGATHVIRPGEINWMTAGRGVVHSERLPRDERVNAMHGMQVWLALPKEAEEVEPFFVHHPAGDFPQFDVDGVHVRALLGEAFGKTSPVKTHSPTLYAELRMPPQSSIRIPPRYHEQALYVVEGLVVTGDVQAGPGTMLVFHEGQSPLAHAKEQSLAVLLGGDRLDGERHIWWNFVSSSQERIEEAARQWARGGFQMVPGDVPDSLAMPPQVFPWKLRKP